MLETNKVYQRSNKTKCTKSTAHIKAAQGHTIYNHSISHYIQIINKELYQIALKKELMIAYTKSQRIDVEIHFFREITVVAYYKTLSNHKNPKVSG
jgi:hypothetical protein